MKDELGRFTAAILVGGFAAVNTKPEDGIIFLLLFILCILWIWLFWRPAGFFAGMVKPEVILAAGSIAAGFLYGMTAERGLAAPLQIDELEVQGYFTDWNIDAGEGRGIFTIEKCNMGVNNLKNLSNLKIKLNGLKYIVRVYPDQAGNLENSWASMKPGDIVRFAGRLENPKMPGTRGQFNLPLYNAVRGLSGSITAKGKIAVVSQRQVPLTWQIRQSIKKTLEKHWPGEAGVLLGIVFGNTADIDQATLNIYQAAGVLHVFAASGSNVAFVMALAWGLLFFLPKRIKVFAVMAAIIFYASLCPGNPPIWRSAIICAAGLLGLLGKGKFPPLRWLLLAGLILFIRNPLFLIDTSFQLSFAAAWGIITLAPPLEKKFLQRHFPRLLRKPAAVTLGAQIATLPILITVFHSVSIIGFFSNVLLLFLLGLVLQLAVIGGVFSFLPVVPLIFFQCAVWLLQAANYGLTFFASLPFAYFWVLNPGPFFGLLWYGLLGIWLAGKEKTVYILRIQLRKINQFRKTLLNQKNNRQNPNPFQFLKNTCIGGRKHFDFVKPFLITIFIVLLFLSKGGTDKYLKITFLDVGQGDGILVQSAWETLLIDTGPRTDTFDAGQKILLPYFLEQGIGRLDMLFITHEDSDHIGGANYLLRNIPVNKVGVPKAGERLRSEAWRTGLPAEIYNNPGKLVQLQAGDKLTFASGLRIEVLGPAKMIEDSGADANNNSLVLLLNYQGTRILLTGDMGREEMQTLAERGADCGAEIIKIPHHGGKSSFQADWFDKLRPRAVFISVGRNNYGHPSQEVLDYWQGKKVPVYRTDLQGTIQVMIDKQGIAVVPGRPDPG